jgi:hypothetical protein
VALGGNEKPSYNRVSPVENWAYSKRRVNEKETNHYLLVAIKNNKRAVNPS